MESLIDTTTRSNRTVISKENEISHPSRDNVQNTTKQQTIRKTNQIIQNHFRHRY